MNYAAGCCFRAVACMAQVLFALNEQYCLNEKGAVALADTLPRRPADFRLRIEAAYALLSPHRDALSKAADILDELRTEAETLLHNAP